MSANPLFFTGLRRSIRAVHYDVDDGLPESAFNDVAIANAAVFNDVMQQGGTELVLVASPDVHPRSDGHGVRNIGDVRAFSDWHGLELPERRPEICVACRTCLSGCVEMKNERGSVQQNSILRIVRCPVSLLCLLGGMMNLNPEPEVVIDL